MDSKDDVNTAADVKVLPTRKDETKILLAPWSKGFNAACDEWEPILARLTARVDKHWRALIDMRDERDGLLAELTKAREALKLIEDHSDDEVARNVAYEAGTKQILGQSAKTK